MTIVIFIKRVKNLNKKKLLQTCLYLTLFGLLSIMPISKASASTAWDLQVNGANTTVNYSYDQLLAMPETDVNANLACYGSPVANGDWGGVSLSYLLSQTGLDPTTASVNFAATDGYKVSLSFEEAMRSDVIIAYQLNGASLPETLRLVLPGYNGNMWISMITSITMSASAAQLSSGNGAGITVPNISTWQSWNSASHSRHRILRRKMRLLLSQLCLQLCLQQCPQLQLQQSPQQMSLNPLRIHQCNKNQTLRA